MPGSYTDFPSAIREYYAYLKSLEPVVEAQAATHYVSASGSGSSNCTIGDPCTITRAVALINAGTINDGHVVEVAAGNYGQALLNITGSGSAGQSITIRGASGTRPRMFGGRYEVPFGDWTISDQCGGTCVYTYELPWNEVTQGWSPWTIIQDNPSTWVNIPVNDASSENVFFEYTEAPAFYRRTTVAEVEAQGGTFWFDSTANIVYAHFYSDSAPVDGDDLYLASSNWGGIDIDGDYITWDGINSEHVVSNTFGIVIDATADNTIYRNADHIGTLMQVEGTNFTVEDVNISNTGRQGEPGPVCDEDPIFVGQCFADSGGFTTLNFSAAGPGTVSRITVVRGWNGIGAANSSHDIIMQDSTVWGFPNHGMGFPGTGNQLLRNIVFNSQESHYTQEGNTPMINFVIENNLFIDKVLFRENQQSNITVRNNIFTSLNVDATAAGGAIADMDCNLYFKLDSILLIDLDAGGGYASIAAIQAATPWEDNGAELAQSDFNSDDQFALFEYPYAPLDYGTWDVHPVTGAQSLNMGASCTNPVGPLGIGEGGGGGGAAAFWRFRRRL